MMKVIDEILATDPGMNGDGKADRDREGRLDILLDYVVLLQADVLFDNID
jgi:hypothetical protein